jgi:hypothetical protein
MRALDRNRKVLQLQHFTEDSTGAVDSDHTKRAHSGPETTYSGSRYGLRHRDPAAGREADM